MLAVVAAVLREHRAEGWLVGGSVRDRELHRDSPDIDIVVTGDASAISRDVARALALPWFALSHEFEAYRVVGERAHVDIAAVREGGIIADLGERDFTINAMAMPVGPDGSLAEPLDPFGGSADLRAKRLVAVSEHIFAQDPLRLMRAARFAHVFGLLIDPSLRTRIGAQVSEIRRAAPERVLTEMILTLDAGRAGDAARLWHGLGLLQAVMPEIGEMDEIDRLFASLDRLEHLLADPRGAFPAAGWSLARRLADRVDGAFTRPTALRLAGLLRNAGTDRAPGLGRRLKLSSPMTSLVHTAARMADQRLPTMAGDISRPGREAVLFLWAAQPWEPEVVVLAAAVIVDGPGAAAQAAAAQAVMAAWATRAAHGVPQLPFDGNLLMERLRLEPGPRLGRALRDARLVWESGEATTEVQAIAAAQAALDQAQ